ncbi:MAG: hypothetical protein WCO04_02490 [Pseudomonadota bacterium]
MSEVSKSTRTEGTANLVQNGCSGRGSFTLQNLIFPEKRLCAEPQMYLHAKGEVAYDPQAGGYRIAQNSLAKFDTYLNALSIVKWHKSCALQGLWLGLTGQGQVEVTVLHALSEGYHDVLTITTVSLALDAEVLVDLSGFGESLVMGAITFQVRALGPDVRLTAARYMTQAPPNPSLRLAIVITTFRREAQVQATARRLAQFFDQAACGAQMTCFIIDNADSAQIDPHPKIHRLANANLGGAGGFTRGLMHAKAEGFSHVLFMDDDAAILMEALQRTFAFLALATDPKTAVAGAFINRTKPARMAENAAVFNRRCRPQFADTDLRQFDAFLEMEQKTALARPSHLYGGWWFFAFSLAAVRHYPFPFFVRGDDVNFSLANDFAITTLNGVAAFGESFVDKETPLTWYLDLRSHLVHHLALKQMAVGRLALISIALAFVRRNIVRFQYETIAAVLMAWRDVLKGPDFFVREPDAASARAAIKALAKTEVWQPIETFDLEERVGFLGHNKALRRLFYPVSLNGHFLPFFGAWGSKRVVLAAQRGFSDAIWGAVQITYLNVAGDRAYVTRKNTLKALWLLGQVLALSVRTILVHDRLRALYRRRYPQITTPEFWRKALNLPSTD